MIFGVIDTRYNICIGSYENSSMSYSSPFNDMTNHFHYEVEADRYAEGYFINEEGNLAYDLSYTPPLQPYQISKKEILINQSEQIKELILDFASENSELLNTYIIENSVEDIPTFVRLHLDGILSEMQPLMEELNGYHYWNIASKMDGITRDSLLRTEARMDEWRDKLLAVVA